MLDMLDDWDSQVSRFRRKCFWCPRLRDLSTHVDQMECLPTVVGIGVSSCHLPRIRSAVPDVAVSREMDALNVLPRICTSLLFSMKYELTISNHIIVGMSRST